MSTTSLYQQSKTTLYNPELPDDYADHDDWLFRTLTEATSIATGARFFALLAEALSTAYRVREVYITECIDKVSVHSVAHWDGGQLVPNEEYAVAGLPCEVVVEGKLLYFPHSVKLFFPDAESESYIGVPLFGATQAVIGHIVMEDMVPRAATPSGISALRVFAARAAAELERDKLQRERDLAYQTLEQRVHERTREIEQRRAVAASLQAILANLNATDSFTAILHSIVQNGCKVFDSSYSLLCAATAAATAVDGYTIEAAFVDRDKFVTSPLPDVATINNATTIAPIIQQAMAQRQPQLGYNDSIPFLALPLLLEDAQAGCLLLFAPALEPQANITLDLAAVYAEQINLALQNARLRKAAELAATMEERNRLARDLHDVVSQTLWSAGLLADVIPDLWETNIVQGRLRLAQLRQLNRLALDELRALLFELRPAAIANLALDALLAQLVHATKRPDQVTITLQAEAGHFVASPAQIAIYRITQEALSNALRHAAATAVTITLARCADQLCLTIVDNGQGFDPAQEHPGRIGLQIMQERAASIAAALTIASTPANGTSIRLCWTQMRADGEAEREPSV